tara:strand:- start:258 stop:1406 length:1149 start_codon:yes stop_codon:yes gene_type:complete
MAKNKSLINNLYQIVKDYRADENEGVGMVNKDRIEQWVDQFDKKDREFILSETVHIFKDKYLSKFEVKNVLLGAIKSMVKFDNPPADIQSFLSNSIFLDLQPKGKSQGIILEILKSVIKDKLNIKIKTSTLDKLNDNQAKHYIYIDDVLCSGNTYYQDIFDFLNSQSNSGDKYYRKLLNGNVYVHNCFIFAHRDNFGKKLTQLKLKLHPDINNNFFQCYYHRLIDNTQDSDSKFEILKPIENHQIQEINDYKDKINLQVDRYINGKYKKADDYFRDPNIPNDEIFFTSFENRIRYEKIVLLKGIEIINNSNAVKPNIRALGYSLPSTRDFGFGTICFTWRNVPNNTPLVYWYSIGGFKALFPKRKSRREFTISLGGEVFTVR